MQWCRSLKKIRRGFEWYSCNPHGDCVSVLRCYGTWGVPQRHLDPVRLRHLVGCVISIKRRGGIHLKIEPETEIEKKSHSNTINKIMKNKTKGTEFQKWWRPRKLYELVSIPFVFTIKYLQIFYFVLCICLNETQDIILSNILKTEMILLSWCENWIIPHALVYK